MSLDYFVELPRLIRTALDEAKIEIATSKHGMGGPNSSHVAVAYPPPHHVDAAPHEDWKQTQEQIDRAAPDFMLHCFKGWAIDALAGRKKIIVCDSLPIPEGVDTGSLLGDESTIPVRVLRFFNISQNKFCWRVDLVVHEFI